MISSAVVIHPHFKNPKTVATRDAEACLEEAVGLAYAIDLTIAAAIIAPVAAPKPATLFGSGKVDEIGELIQQHEAALAIVNSDLSPIQQRNLEKAWGCKVIDRTALILEIFGARARTHEGKLQVELAALEYQKSRLVRSWTHLERQRGGFGFLGGPGESQIEIDRRLIRDRIAKIKKQLKEVTRTRELHRKNRRDVPYPIVALVGYTNAGKSTLFNKLTGAKVLAMDKLFATLDPTMRSLNLPSGGKVILSDTVGFVSDLPTELVAAFSATLEEVLGADILLHVRDITHPDSDAQKQDVEAVLKKLFTGDRLPEHMVEVCNKIDLLPEIPENSEEKIYVSAATGTGLKALLTFIDDSLRKRFFTQTKATIPAADGKAFAWLHSHGKIVAQEAEDEYIHLTIELSAENHERFQRAYPDYC